MQRIALKKDGHGGFQLVGNAILIDPVPQNVAYLKEAIQKKKKPNRVTCDADEINMGDGSVVTLGHPTWGGDRSAVQNQLTKVPQIQAFHGAFAAILCDGSIVTWGNPILGGDSIAVQEQRCPPPTSAQGLMHTW